MSRQFKVTVNGREYDVNIIELTAGQATTAPSAIPLSSPMPAAGATANAMPPVASTVPNTPAAGSGDVVAGMGGVVVEVDAKVGQTVAAGDRLLVLEAMKMKTPIVATRGGQVTRVLVSPGDAVEGGQALVTIV